MGSVPRSIADPLLSNRANVEGFLNVLVAARDARCETLCVCRIVVYLWRPSRAAQGGRPIGKPLSPYAVTKYVNELYADVFSRSYGMDSIGLRYFNVFGPRQDPQGAYAAVIPRWFEQLCQGIAPQINGDGETSRDFCFIDNTVQANLLAATSEKFGGL